MRGNDFLFDAFGSSKYLEDLTGISELISEQHEVSTFQTRQAKEVKIIVFLYYTQIIEMDDSDFDLSD